MNLPFSQLVHALATPAPAVPPAAPLSSKPRPFVPGFPSMFTPPTIPAAPTKPQLPRRAEVPPPAPTLRKPLTLRGPSGPGTSRNLGSTGSNPPHVGNFPKPGKKVPTPLKLSMAHHLASLQNPPDAPA